MASWTSRFVAYIVAVAMFLFAGPATAQDKPVGIVSHVKVVSDKVPDVSSMEAWKKSFIKEDMKPAQKAMAVWKTVAMFGLEGAPINEFMGGDECLHDAIKTFNVYGCNYCDCSGAMIASLGRYAGLESRGWGLNGHMLSELYYDNSWHMLDAAYMNYFPKPDGSLASVEEIRAAAKEWYTANPGYQGNGGKLTAFAANGGWKKGPALLAACPLTDENGNYPCAYGSWAKTMVNYDGGAGTPSLYESGYHQGYQVNIQLRKGERLTRNWSNKGKALAIPTGMGPEILDSKIAQGILKHTPEMGDLSNGRVGHGLHEYDVPLADGGFRGGALAAENLACKADGAVYKTALALKDAAKPGVLTIRMPSSYLYLSGQVALQAVVGQGGEIRVAFSQNNGLDWIDLPKITKSGGQTIDLTEKITRRYDYQIRFTLVGAGTGLDSLKITHDILQSQRALPALDKGDNTITFSAAPSEGTVTIAGNTDPNCTRQLTVFDFHPELVKVNKGNLTVDGRGMATFRVTAPGDITALRFGGNYRARDKKDGWDYQVSFDDGKTFQTIDRAAGPTRSNCKYVTVDKIPAATKQALVRLAGKSVNITCMFRLQIDADYKEPQGGFRPIKITYQWEEDGKAKEDVHVAKGADEKYTIKCASKPTMKAIILEWAQ